MKVFLLLVAGVSVGLAYMIASQKMTVAANASKPVEDLAHKLQDAWADHHTVA